MVSSGNTKPFPRDPSTNGALGNPKVVEPVATSSYLDASRTKRPTYSVNRNLTNVSPKCDVMAEISCKAQPIILRTLIRGKSTYVFDEHIVRIVRPCCKIGFLIGLRPVSRSYPCDFLFTRSRVFSTNYTRARDEGNDGRRHGNYGERNMDVFGDHYSTSPNVHQQVP